MTPAQDSNYYKIRQIRECIITEGSKHYQAFPWRNPEQKWHGLLAEMLLQRTRASSVVPIYEKLIKIYPYPEDLAFAPINRLEEILYPLGLKWRSKYVHAFAVSLLAIGNTPEKLDELTSLPGIGQYAANAFLAFHTDKRAILIDSNTARFVCRITGNDYHGEIRRKRWLIEFIDRLTPCKSSKIFNLSFLDFAMVTCSVRTPSCAKCPLSKLGCKFVSQ
ncbi:MAG: hypothetical protein H8D23_13245 [Candidatus Brocadiales bacterium]|nr:hypothetical protein [Candidatus Brocadiales bacterium]